MTIPAWLQLSDGTLCLSGYPIQIFRSYPSKYIVKSPKQQVSMPTLQDAKSLAAIWKIRLDLAEASQEHHLSGLKWNPNAAFLPQ